MRTLFTCCLCLCLACSEDDTVPAALSVAGEVLEGTDVADAAPPDVDAPPEKGGRVPIDLAPWSAGAAGAFVRQVTDAKDLLDGDAAHGRLGDWAMGNAKARFIIQGIDRHSGPCPWGGNVIDAAMVDASGKGSDVAGEACPFIQLGRTFLPKTYEILADGSSGPAVLAVTGEDTVLDFLNISSLVESYVGPGITLPIDSNVDVPVTITMYYVLSADSTALRVMTAYRNDSDADAVALLAGDIVDSGGQVEFFNPASSKKGFGYAGFTPEPIDFLAFAGPSGSYAISPDPGADGGPNGSYLAISGVAGIGYGTTNILGLLTGDAESFQKSSAVMKLAPGESSSVGKWIAAGNGSVSSLTDAIYAHRKVATGTVTVTAKDTAGAAVAGLRVSFGAKGGALTQGVTGADGTFTASLPAGTWDVMPDLAGRRVTSAPPVTVTAGAGSDAPVTLEAQGRLAVTIVDGAGKPVSAKVSVMCKDAKCADAPTPAHRDTGTDRLPDGARAVAFAGVDGKVDVPVPSGDYQVVVSRGPVWSVWPNDDLSGQPVVVEAGKDALVAAVIDKVVPTDGWLSGDFHVHAVNSPDSPIPHDLRVLSMLAEGVDVIVSTDHDFITDFAPTITALGADKVVTSIVGEELTTFDYGHFNAFPLALDSNDLTGGAIDWGQGEGFNMRPAEIFAALGGGQPGRVIQVNHPDGGYFNYMKWDAKSDATYEKPEKFRMAPGETTAEGDTQLWSDNFTSFEILNGLDSSRFYRNAGWWFTLLSRGIPRTATAVSDTHKSVKDASGGARSWVWVGEDHDTPETFDETMFAKNVNAGRLTGAIGPFLVVTAKGADGAEAAVGDTLKLPAAGGTVTFTARVMTPKWMQVSEVDLLGNITDAAPKPGVVAAISPKPLATQKLAATDKGAYSEYTATLEVEAKTDGWYVIVVSGDDAPSLLPVLPDAKARPFAYTNAFWVDVGGDGWTPLIQKAKPAQKPGAEHHEHEHGTFDRPGLEAFIDWVKNERSCSH